ncbi:MAG: hypothetical protein Q8L48_30940 [Archangium sp.]|nr:hypothetical protein [Archangium sp.]
MRQTLMFAAMTVMTACGASGNTPWDQNHDGLITACEGLNPQACDANDRCERTPVVCTMECRDDGHGGCLPCAGADVCRPLPPPPLFDCSHLPLNLCAATPRCEVVHAQACSGGAEAPSPSDPSVPPLPRCGVPDCQTIDTCANRQPAQCESLSNDVCLSQPGCALQAFGAVCEIACDPDSGNCPPCAMPQLHCITLPPPDVCGSRDPNVCSMDGRCVLEQGAVCDAACAPDGTCPPCAIASVRCVPAPPPDVCAGRDLNSCDFDGRCAVQAWACPAICKPDGNGGCVPCEAPPAACVPVVSSCETNADRASCLAAGCSVIDLGLACTTECRDDGHGGCLPCKDFVCTDGSGSGGGTPPPQP